MNSRFLAIALISISACTSDKGDAADTSQTQAINASEAKGREDLIPKGEAAPPPAPSTPTATEPKGGKWDVTFSGIGDLRAGMSLDEANVVANGDLVIPSRLSDCDYIKPKTGPAGVAFLFENGKLAVVDVKSGSVKTVEGARIGDTEDQIRALYPGRVTSRPAKYTAGHRLIVKPKTGGNNRIVFETDGVKVTQFSSGSEPAVEYVEGCG
jgi:hypothetical protein